MGGGSQVRSKAPDSRSGPVGVRGFKSLPPHHRSSSDLSSFYFARRRVRWEVILVEEGEVDKAKEHVEDQ